VSETYRQSLSDELAAAIDARRGLLSRQEYTTLALIAALEQPTVAELRRELAELRDLVERLTAAPATMPCGGVVLTPSATEMLSF